MNETAEPKIDLSSADIPEELPPELIAKMRMHFASATPHARAIGMELVHARRAEAWLRLPYQPVFVGNTTTGAMHGGVITALLDQTCGAAVQLTRRMQLAIATLDLRIDYMKPARNDLPVSCHAHCYKMTKNIAFVRATAYQDGESDLIANVVATFMLAANRTSLSKRTAPPAIVAEIGPTAAEFTEAASEFDAGRDSVLAQSPYARFLGVEVDKSGDTITSILRYRPRLIGNPHLPALHGGAIGAFLETAAMVQVVAETGADRSPKPIGLTINYLRSGRPVDTFARAKITKQGRRVASIAVEAWQDDPEKPIASAYGHFLLKADAESGSQG